MLIDQYGHEIKTNRPIMREVATQTVRDRYSTYPSAGLTPSRLAAIFREADQGDVARQAELFEEMEEKDLHLTGLLQTRKLAVTGLEWEILPASESREDKMIAAAAKEMIEYIENWEDALLDLLDAIGKGFCVSEIMWEIAEGKVWAVALEWVHQRRFTFNSPEMLLKNPRLITDDEPVWGEELPPNKFIVHRYKARSGAISRGGILRPCAYMYLFKNYDIKDWLIFNELFSVPMRIGKYRPGTTPAEIDALKQAVFNLGVDAAAVISDSTIIELVEARASGSNTSHMDFADFCDRAMSKAVLGHTGSAEGTPGRLGNEAQAGNIRQDLLESDAKALMKTIKFQLLAPWVMYNYGPGRGVPKYKIHFEGSEDLETTARVYGILVRDVGYNKISTKHIQDRFGIPAPEADEELVSAPGYSPWMQTMANKADIVTPAEKTRITQAQRHIDSMADEAVRQGLPDLSVFAEIVDDVASYEELQARIAEIYGGVDMQQFRDVLAAALLVADLRGRALA